MSQNELDEMYNNGVRVLIFVNNLSSPDQLYFLALVSDVVTPQAYSPASSESGVLSVNGRTGAVILYANNITLRSGVLETVDGALTSIRNSVGTLSSLTTDDKTSIVAALNEVDSNANNAASAAATAQTAANNAASAAATAQSTADGAVTAAGEAQTTANSAATAAATAQNTADAAVQGAANVAADLGDKEDLETPVTTDVVAAVNSLNDQKANKESVTYVETGTTATTAYNKGAYINWNGDVYRTTKNIAQGATFATSGGDQNLESISGGTVNDLISNRLVNQIGWLEVKETVMYGHTLYFPAFIGSYAISFFTISSTNIRLFYLNISVQMAVDGTLTVTKSLENSVLNAGQPEATNYCTVTLKQ